VSAGLPLGIDGLAGDKACYAWKGRFATSQTESEVVRAWHEGPF
jgi:hypothetical protein